MNGSSPAGSDDRTECDCDSRIETFISSVYAVWSGIGIGAAVGIVLFSFAGYAAYNCICTRKPSNTETDFAAVDMNVQVGLGPRNQQGSNNVSETLVLDRNRLIWEKKNEKINLMLRPDLKATHLEIQAMDAGALGIRPSQIPKRIFFKRLLSRFSTLFKRHLEDADETSCFFAHPKDCAKSGYSRRERAARRTTTTGGTATTTAM